MLRNFCKVLSLTTVVAVLSLTTLKAQAYLFVSSTGTPTVLSYDPTTAKFTDTFVAGNSSILRYDETTGKFIDTFVPPGRIGVSAGIAFGSDGNLYAADTANNSVLRFDGQTGAFIDDFIPSGSSGLFRPEDVVFGPDNSLYVSSLYGGGVLRYNATTGAFIDAVATSVPANGAKLAAAGLDVGPDGNLYISSVFNYNDILKYKPKPGTLDTFIPTDIAPTIPGGSTFGPDGNFYDGDYLVNGASIRRYDGQTGAFIDTFVPPGSGGLSKASRELFGPDGNLYVSSLGSDSVLRYDGQTGAFIDAFVPAGSGGVKEPAGLAFFTPQAVPEPSSLLGMLGFCAYVGTSLVLKRKQKKQKSANLDTSTGSVM